jgi:hypothetical protein
LLLLMLLLLLPPLLLLPLLPPAQRLLPTQLPSFHFLATTALYHGTRRAILLDTAIEIGALPCVASSLHSPLIQQ